jgi:hypothetical protein
VPRSPDFPRAHAYTQYLRIPLVDWPAISQGHKTEFRAVGRDSTHANLLQAPAPIVGWTRQRFRSDVERALLVLEETWTEPLMAITPDSLAREGFRSHREFRRYWNRRHRVGFKPLSTVNVYRLRPWREGDRDWLAALLMEHLYGEWL